VTPHTATGTNEQPGSRSLGQRVAWNTSAQVAGRIGTLGLGFLVTIVLTRYLGVAGYGDYTAVLVYVSLFFVFFDLGTYTLLVRLMSQREEVAAEILDKALALRIALSVGIAAIAAPLAFAVYPGADQEQLRVGILVALPSIVLQSVATTIAAMFQARLQLDRVALAEIVSQVAFAALVVGLAATNRSFYAIVGATVATAAVNATVVAALARRVVPLLPRIDGAFWKRLFVQSLPLGLALVINTIYFRVDALLLSVLRGSEDVGIYGVAYRFLETTTPFAYFLVASLFPLLSAAAANRDERSLDDISQRAFDLLSLGAIFVVSAVAAASPGLVELVAGADFGEAVTPLRIVIVGAGLMFLNTYFAYLLVAIERQTAVLGLMAAALIVNVTLNLALIPEYGYNAAATVATASEALVFTGFLWLARRFLGFRPSLHVAARGALAGLVLFAITLGLPTHVVPALAVGTLAFAAALYVLRVHEAIELPAVVFGPRP
jgi:O-antigen/teichoic acid export membrane protein